MKINLLKYYISLVIIICSNYLAAQEYKSTSIPVSEITVPPGKPDNWNTANDYIFWDFYITGTLNINQLPVSIRNLILQGNKNVELWSQLAPTTNYGVRAQNSHGVASAGGGHVVLTTGPGLTLRAESPWGYYSGLTPNFNGLNVTTSNGIIMQWYDENSVRLGLLPQKNSYSVKEQRDVIFPAFFRENYVLHIYI